MTQQQALAIYSMFREHQLIAWRFYVEAATATDAKREVEAMARAMTLALPPSLRGQIKVNIEIR